MKPRLADWRHAAAAFSRWLKSVDSGLTHLHRLYGAPGRTMVTGRTLRLGSGEVLRFTRTSGVQEIEVHRGEVWLTGTPASSDVLLRAGDRFVCTGDWPVVIQALSHAAITLSPG